MNDCLDCGRPAEDRQLCQPCTTRLDGRLADLGSFYRQLAKFLAPGSSGSGPIGRTKSPDAPLPVVEEVLVLRGPGGLLGVLEDWVSALWVGPLPAATGGYETRVDAAVTTLRRMLPYISTSFPGAGDFATEIREQHQAAKSIVDPQPKSIRAGLCTAEVDGGECGAALRYHPGDTEIVCAWCKTVYTPTDWLGLAAAS